MHNPMPKQRREAKDKEYHDGDDPGPGLACAQPVRQGQGPALEGGRVDFEQDAEDEEEEES